VEPKRQALKSAQDQLAKTMAELKEAQEKLASVQAKIAQLEHEYDEAVAKKDALAKQVHSPPHTPLSTHHMEPQRCPMMLRHRHSPLPSSLASCRRL
jgi:chromosome segregation ATPase